MSKTTVVVTDLVTVTAPTSTSTSRATPQGGIFDGLNPANYDPKNPLIVFIIQAVIIIGFCRLLHYPLSRIRQPRVIAEVIGGILLGPSVMGHVPGFTDAIFPAASMPNLTLVADIGLVLFLFLVGLEVDFRFLVSNWKVACGVGTAGMALPFGLGCALAWGLYSEFRNEPGTVPISFGVFMLFIGVAMAITAFPVLCRILTELKLLSTPVGIIVLSAGVANDVVGWVLLALCVALVNAGSGITALWVLLTAIGYTLFLIFAFRPVFMMVLRRTRSLDDGPSQSIVALTLMVALFSAFFTGIIGIHPIFGGFLVGLICPHDGGFAIKTTEKVEDIVCALFLPLYFALSGLSTNLGLLNTGMTWAYVVAVTVVAFFAKIIGGSGAARLSGRVWRECFTIGALMSCKGLVELIVLNVGLQAKILSTRVFTIFVVMALITTFATTPLTAALYPPKYQKKLEEWKRGDIDWDTGRPLHADTQFDGHSLAGPDKAEASFLLRFLVYLRLDSMPSMFSFISLLESSQAASRRAVLDDKRTTEDQENPDTTAQERSIEIYGLRLLELTERGSSVMRVSETDESTMIDPVVNTLRAFGRLQNMSVSGEVAIVPQNSYSDTLIEKASEVYTDLLLVPWSESGSMSESQAISANVQHNKLGKGPFADFVSRLLETATCNVGVFVNNGFGGAITNTPRRLSRAVSTLSTRSIANRHSPLDNRSHHIFFPYIGSEDDRLALRFVLQLAQHIHVSAKIVRFEDLKHTPVEGGSNDASFAKQGNAAFFDSLCSSLPAAMESRVKVEVIRSQDIMEDILHAVVEEVKAHPKNAGNLVIAGRDSSLGSCFGTTGERILELKLETSLLVLQANVASHGQ